MASVFADKFYDTFSSEAYVKSQYLSYEHSIAQLFYSVLFNLGYQSNDVNQRVWENHEKTVVICLSDSFMFNQTLKSRSPSTAHLISRSSYQGFDANTVIITDNYALFQPQCTILRLPDSYFGIYNYAPSISEFCPTKRFNFSINRIDQTRELILLELINQSGGVDSWMQQDHVNFNCYTPNGNNYSVDDIKTNFLNIWSKLSSLDPKYSTIVTQLLDHLPLRTHQLTIEQAHVSAYLNLVVESYTNDTAIAVSEKIFRALVTPSPWTLFGCVGTVDWLTSLGFDVLGDLVDHEYNNVCYGTSYYGLKKIQAYIASSIEISKKLEIMEIQQLTNRCKKAAEHNQQLLTELRHRWPQDFANWLPTAISKITGK